MTNTHEERTAEAARAGTVVGNQLAWMGILRAALIKRLQVTDPASRTRWREYVRVVLLKIKAARKEREPPPGARLQHAVGKALATAGLIGGRDADA